MRNPGNETIAAAATGAGGGIGIVRISGPAALAIADRVFRSRAGRPLEAFAPFHLVLGTAGDPDSGEPIDEVFAVRMPEGGSYTGETTVEIQGHGGRVVLDAVLDAALRAGARLAGPGEFTKRAFLSGRIDLTQAEAVAEIIGAENDEMRRTALRHLRGAVADEVGAIRERLLDLVARAEAALDFEEGEIPDDFSSTAQIDSLAGAIRSLASQAGSAATRPGGISVAIVGPANSGKSSIFNYLLDFERSIVAPVPGTTRDYVEERALIGGTSMTLIDTAGLRATDDAVEAEGVCRSISHIETAAIVVIVIDGSEPNQPEENRLFELAADRSPIVLISKSDLPSRLDQGRLRLRTADSAVFTLSTVTGTGFPDFIAALTTRCRAIVQTNVGSGTVPNVRHRNALERAAERLGAAAGHGRSGSGFHDRMALELRAALAALEEITGQSATEEILERIFSRFCVGK